MSNLSDTVQKTRLIIFAFIAFCIIVLVGQWVIKQFQSKKVKPGPVSSTPFLDATKLSSAYSRYNFQSLALADGSNPEFVTVGNFKTINNTPNITTSVNVYKINEKKINLSSLDKARRQAEALKLDSNYENIDSNIYRWRDSRNRVSMEFNRTDHSVRVRSDLYTASKYPVEKPVDTEQYIQDARDIASKLEITTDELSAGTAKVDYIYVNPDRTVHSTDNPDNAQLIRVTLFKSLQSATLKNSSQGNTVTTTTTLNTPTNIESTIIRPDMINGSITMYFNAGIAEIDENTKQTKQLDAIDRLVWLDYMPLDYTESVTTSITTGTQNKNKFQFDVYQTIGIGTAYEMIKAGTDGAYLAYLYIPGTDIFATYEPLNVKKFSVEAAKTTIVYIEPETWEHLNPDVTWDAHLYPYYWFEGIALLDNGEEANFVFLVDPIPR